MNSIKTLFSILLLVVVTQFNFAQKQTLFVDKNFETVMQQAKLEKKPVVLMFYAGWCVHCNKMKNEVFITQDVINFYDQNYICISADIESNEGKLLRDKLKNKLLVTSFPTFGFFDYDENLTNTIVGEFKSEDFIREGFTNLDSGNHLENVKSNFEKDPSNYDKCFSYILVTKRTGFNSTSIAQKYLKTVSTNDYYTEKNWRLIANGITDFEAPEFIDLIRSQNKFEAVISKKRIEKKINFVINDNFANYIAANDTATYKKNREIATKFKLRAIDSLLFHQDLNLYERANKWNDYDAVLEKSMTEFGLKDAQFINNVCANYFIYVTDKKKLEKAVNWEKVAIELNPSLDKYVLISNLLLKSKNYKEGIEYATKGKEFGKNLGFNTTEIENVLRELIAQSKK
ncbi:thioredoxin family protein [Flavobacterium sp.]